MINAIRCDQTSFKSVEFSKGFNVVLAERTKESTKRDSRNGLGKSTLIEIIHFCLGAGAKKNAGLLVEPLMGWTFRLEFTIRDCTLEVSRSTDNPSKVRIEGDTTNWPIQPYRENGGYWLRVQDWNLLLGYLFFSLPIEKEDKLYQPSFRSSISYFIRRGRDAFSTPFEHYRKQLEWDKQVHNAMLLGLEWRHAVEWQLLRDKDNFLKSLSRGIKVGEFDRFFGSIGELEAQIIRLESETKTQGLRLREFRVHPEYANIENQANILTGEIHAFSNENLGDRRILDYYRSSIEEERDVDSGKVANLYELAKIEFPDTVTRRLSDVLEFHKKIIENRRLFLSSEMDRISRAISEREEIIAKKSDERAKLMNVLDTHGALAEYNELQSMYTDSLSRLKDYEARLKMLREFEAGKSNARVMREDLLQRARIDYEERRPQRERAVAYFNANSEALYDAPGNLIIDIKPTGFHFDVEIERAESQGISNMKIFCYDLMLAQIWKESNPAFCVLVHDSIIFDGVDERQVAQALERAAMESDAHNFQYICTLNSDTLPHSDFSKDFDISQFVRLKLSDLSEAGRLLGIRY